MRERRIAFICVVMLGSRDVAVATSPRRMPWKFRRRRPQRRPRRRHRLAETAPASGELADRIAAADPAQGRIQFIQCRACHSLVPESEPGKIGPTLYGVIGRAAGTARGYTYSEAVAESGITWTADQIDKWLQQPSDFLPGNKMVFVGIEGPQDRANIIAYIQQESAKSLP